MKFNYPEISTISFMDMRLYVIPSGQYYPSITTVLGKSQSKEKQDSLESWRNSLGHEEAAAQTKAAADRGTAVHLLAERFLKSEHLVGDGEIVNPTHMAAFNALKLKLRRVTSIYGQEVALFSNKLSIAGRADLIGEYNGVPSIVDFKTSTRIKGSDKVDDYRLQLCAYAIMHNEMFGTNIDNGVILMTSDGGFPQEFTVKLSDYVEELKTRINSFNCWLSRHIEEGINRDSNYYTRNLL